MLSLSHIGLAVTDLSRSAKFYSDILGFSIGNTYSVQDLKILLLYNETTTIELLERQNDPLAPRQTGFWDHVTFQVMDIDSMHHKLKSHNVSLIDQEPRMSVFGKRILFFAGPDGERIELKEA